ncbi:MAG: RNA polymerase sigma factor [Candidatus Cryptobacteroides sp.]
MEALLAGDEKITHNFFYVWCRPLLCSLIHKIFNYDVDYDEIVSELYLYLMEKDGKRLRTFQGRSSIYQWLKCVATRFFLNKRDRGQVIEDSSSETLYPLEVGIIETEEIEAVRQDVHTMLGMMTNHRHRLVIQRIFIDGYDYQEIAKELNTSLANLYNIKKRAITEFASIVLKEYGKQ